MLTWTASYIHYVYNHFLETFLYLIICAFPYIRPVLYCTVHTADITCCEVLVRQMERKDKCCRNVSRGAVSLFISDICPKIAFSGFPRVHVFHSFTDLKLYRFEIAQPLLFM